MGVRKFESEYISAQGLITKQLLKWWLKTLLSRQSNISVIVHWISFIIYKTPACTYAFTIINYHIATYVIDKPMR